jgi:hypothetical protein
MKLYVKDQSAYCRWLHAKLLSEEPDMRLIPGEGGEPLRLRRTVLFTKSPFLASLINKDHRHFNLYLIY